MQKIKKILIFIAIFSILAMPAFSFAVEWTGLIPCGTSYSGRNLPCEFKDIMALINKLIHFVLFYLAVPISAIMFAYAGFVMVTSGGSSEARGKAKNVFTNALFGLVIAAGAYLIIKTILSILGYEGDWIGF